MSKNQETDMFQPEMDHAFRFMRYIRSKITTYN